MANAALADLGLKSHHIDFLTQYHFDAPSFLRLKKALETGAFPLERNQVTGPVSPLQPGDVTAWPKADSDAGQKLFDLGQQAIERGEVGVAILNGGMATRFGGVVKGVVEVCAKHSFLALKIRDIARQKGPIPVFLLNSFATRKDTQAHLHENAHFGIDKKRIVEVTQSISLRLTPQGQIFFGKNHDPSFFAPGHGDLLGALAQSPELATFRQNGGKYLAVSNVDNLAATLSPYVVGAHMASQKEVTVEVAPREAGDAGGAPVRYNNRIEVLEGFRFPANFDTNTLSVFNTNTFVFSLHAIKADYPLTWFRADKKVDGEAAVQFERLVGEVTSFTDSHYLQVPRSGPQSRFLPVKAPTDLQKIIPWVETHLLA